MRSFWRRSSAIGAIASVHAFAVVSHAQWSVTALHPSALEDGNWSVVSGLDSGQQVGRADVGGRNHAALWRGSAESWVDLHPPEASESWSFGVFGNQQVGRAYLGGVFHASLWSGTAESWIDLNPSGATWSEAWCISEDQQVGSAGVGDAQHAVLWTGTAASWVDLHPIDGGHSWATGVHNGRQVGSVILGSTHRAAMWSGTAATWQDLHPPGAVWSAANAIHGVQQVGFCGVGGSQHASLWTGTADSWVSLHYAGSALSVFAGNQAGYFFASDGQPRASVWHGTADSLEELHSSLVGDWSVSYATGIWNDHATVYVAGYGFNVARNRWEALLWSRPIPAPVTGACCLGTSCVTATFESCAELNGTFQGDDVHCGEAGNPTTCCRANWDGVNGVDVPDIFGFLSTWFTGVYPLSDFNLDHAVNAADIFAFLGAWFGRCD